MQVALDFFGHIFFNLSFKYSTSSYKRRALNKRRPIISAGSWTLRSNKRPLISAGPQNTARTRKMTII